MANLAALLDQEASAEIKSIISEAQGRASEIIDKAKAEAEGFFNEKKRSIESQSEAEIVRAKSAPQLEASSVKLQIQHDAVESVFANVKEELQALVKDKKSYGSTLENLLKEASEAVGGNLSSIVVNLSLIHI